MNIITKIIASTAGIHDCTGVLIAQKHTNGKCMYIIWLYYLWGTMPIKIYYLLLNTNNAGQYQFYVICIGLDLSSANRRGGSGGWKSATATHTHTHTRTHTHSINFTTCT